MSYAYRTVDTSTLTGLKAAERLKAQGWKIIRTGLFLLTFEKAVRSPASKRAPTA